MKHLALVAVALTFAVTGCTETSTQPPLMIEPSPSAQQFLDALKQTQPFPRAHPYEGEIGVQFPNQNPSSMNLDYRNVKRTVIEIPQGKYGTIPIPENGRFTLVELQPKQNVVEVASLPYPPELASQRWNQLTEVGDINQGIPLKALRPGTTLFGFDAPNGRTLIEIHVVPIP